MSEIKMELPDTKGPYRVSIDSSGQITNSQGEILCTVHRRGRTNLNYNWKHDEVFIVNACNYFFSLRADLEAAQAKIAELCLERIRLVAEAGKAQKELEAAEAENARLKAELEAAKEDSKRLNWIDRYMDCTLAGPGLHISRVEIGDDQTLREAIDEAMKEQAERK